MSLVSTGKSHSNSLLCTIIFLYKDPQAPEQPGKRYRCFPWSSPCGGSAGQPPHQHAAKAALEAPDPDFCLKAKYQFLLLVHQCIEGKQEQYVMCEVHSCAAHYHLLDWVREKRAAATEIWVCNNEGDINTQFCPSSHSSARQGEQDMLTEFPARRGETQKVVPLLSCPTLNSFFPYPFSWFPSNLSKVEWQSVESCWQNYSPLKVRSSHQQPGLQDHWGVCGITNSNVLLKSARPGIWT